jgi:3-oxoacyl-[acyl-carrier protein] reductase
MDLGLAGKGVIVTGASRGIGFAIAQAFAREGANVAICARGAAGVEKAAGELRALGGGKVHAAACDIADKAALETFLGGAKEALGAVHVLVNNASGFGVMDNEDGWASGFGVDVMAAVRSTWKVAPWIAEAGGGAIVHISSISGMDASTTIPYGAVKAALQSFSVSSAKALAKKNIRVNAVAPGSIEFPGGSWEAIGKANPKMYESVRRGIPFGRLGAPEEVADVVVFLASERGRWVTGVTLAVDGGQLIG